MPRSTPAQITPARSSGKAGSIASTLAVRIAGRRGLSSRRTRHFPRILSRRVTTLLDERISSEPSGLGVGRRARRDRIRSGCRCPRGRSGWSGRREVLEVLPREARRLHQPRQTRRGAVERTLESLEDRRLMNYSPLGTSYPDLTVVGSAPPVAAYGTPITVSADLVNLGSSTVIEPTSLAPGDQGTSARLPPQSVSTCLETQGSSHPTPSSSAISPRLPFPRPESSN